VRCPKSLFYLVNNVLADYRTEQSKQFLMHHGGKKHQSSVYLSKTPKVTIFFAQTLSKGIKYFCHLTSNQKKPERIACAVQGKSVSPKRISKNLWKKLDDFTDEKVHSL